MEIGAHKTTRWVALRAVVVVLTLATAACGNGSGFDSGVENTDLSIEDLAAALLQADDLEQLGAATSREQRVDVSGDDVTGYLAVCGEPLFIRAGDNPISLRSSYRIDNTTEVAHTVRVFETADAAAIVNDTQAAADTCVEPWTEEFELASVTTELLDPLGIAPRGETFSETQATVDSTINVNVIFNVILQMQCGPVVSRVAVNANTMADASFVETVATEAYQRLVSTIESVGGQCPDAP